LALATTTLVMSIARADDTVVVDRSGVRTAGWITMGVGFGGVTLGLIRRS
jgi:hypothetical protein